MRTSVPLNIPFIPASISHCQFNRVSLTKIRQKFERPVVGDIQKAVTQQLDSCGIRLSVGAEIAIAVGSRGIANIAQVVRAVVEFVSNCGATPFIIPAMGSHGGATAEGQKELLGSFGITEESVSCEIRSSMEVVSLPADGLEHGLFMDGHAFNSAGIILINRVKPHTDFHGPYESGLMKMAVIGLGKERQAFEMHQFGTRGLKELVPKAAEHVLATGKILAGVGIVENAYDETALIEVIPGSQILKREPSLLEKARQNMPRLPVNDIDVLIVDQLGKNISGTGLDTNMIGRIRINTEPEPTEPRIKSVVVTSLTEESHGNATGIGLADVITHRLLESIDFGITYTNIVTSGFLERAKMPIVAENDEQALAIALRGAGCREQQSAKIVRILDTLHLGELYVSDAVKNELESLSSIEVIGSPTPLFNSNGELHAF